MRLSILLWVCSFVMASCSVEADKSDNLQKPYEISARKMASQFELEPIGATKKFSGSLVKIHGKVAKIIGQDNILVYLTTNSKVQIILITKSLVGEFQPFASSVGRLESFKEQTAWILCKRIEFYQDAAEGDGDISP